VFVERGVEADEVEPELGGVGLEGRSLQAFRLFLPCEEQLAHLPEAGVALLGGDLERGLGSELGVGVEGQRELAEDEAHLPAVLLHDILDRRLDATAVGTLEIREFLDDDPGARVAPRGGRGGGRPDGLPLGGRWRLAVLDEGRVERLERRTAVEERLGAGELLVDDDPEFLERLRAHELAAVDEEVGRARGLEVVGEVDVLLDVPPVFLRGNSRGRGGRVEADLGRDRRERVVVELRRRGEERVVGGPEARLALPRERLAGQLGGGHRAAVAAQGVVLPYDADPVAVRRPHLGERALDALAVGALEVRELDDGDLSVPWATRGRGAGVDAPDGAIRRRRGRGGLARLSIGQRAAHRPARDVGPLAGLGRVGQRCLDRGAQRLDGRRDPDRRAVDQHVASGEAEARGEGVIDGELGGEPPLVQAPLEGAHVGDPGVLAPAQIGRSAELLLLVERHREEPPERLLAAELQGALGSLGSGLRLGVRGVRFVLPYEPQPGGAELVHQLQEGRRRPRHPRVLEIAEEHERDGRGRVAERRISPGDQRHVDALDEAGGDAGGSGVVRGEAGGRRGVGAGAAGSGRGGGGRGARSDEREQRQPGRRGRGTQHRRGMLPLTRGGNGQPEVPPGCRPARRVAGFAQRPPTLPGRALGLAPLARARRGWCGLALASPISPATRRPVPRGIDPPPSGPLRRSSRR
jgi:hypothetical protein